MNGRSWNKTLGILILINGALIFLHLVFNSMYVPAIYSNLPVWDNFPYFFYRLGHDPDARQTLAILSIILQIFEFIMVILILVFGGLMKSHYKDKNLTKFWRKILAGGIMQILVWVSYVFYEPLFTRIYDRYLSIYEAWEENVAYEVFSGIYPGIWNAIIGVITIVMAVNHLIAWLNFRSFSKDHMHRKITNGALLISLGAIPIILGELLKDSLFGLGVFWTLFDYEIIATLPDFVQNIGRDGWMYLDFTIAMFIGIVSYVIITTGQIITGIHVMATKKPANITEEPVLEHFHDSAWKSPSPTKKTSNKTQLKQTKVKTCPNCGNTLAVNTPFCPYCGNSL